MTKRTLLTYLADASEAGAKDVADAFGWATRSPRWRYYVPVRQGLASRYRTNERGVYRYRLSERGQSRLKYLGGKRRIS